MGFDQSEIQEFRNEADELLETAERSLLLLDKGAPLAAHYDAIFRAFHSIKGAAGMMEMTELQGHMHKLETIFTEHKGVTRVEKPLIDLFLRGLDGTRQLLEGGSIVFDYTVGGTPAPKKPDEGNSGAEPLSQPPLGRILIVDDEPEIVDLLSTILTGENIEVLGLTSPLEVMETIKTFKPDALFTDIAMPDIDGMQLLEMVSKVHADLPVVFISGYVNKDVLLNAIRLGVFAAIEKPFDIVRVVECARNAIERHRLSKVVTSSINLLMYQFSDLTEFLKSTGKTDISNSISTEITSLIKQRRLLRKRQT